MALLTLSTTSQPTAAEAASGAREIDRNVAGRIGIEAADLHPCRRQVRREPPTGLTEPEDRNPSQARGLLPLLNSDSVHRILGVRETYPRVRQNC